MQAVVRRDMSDAAFDFQRLVWPAIADHCGGGQFVSTEKHQGDAVAECLDMCAGIDGVQVREDLAAVRGFAIRIQWCSESFDTFTIRQTRRSGAQTELEKRNLQIQQIQRGAMYPFYTVQAYITKRRTGRLLKAAVTTTTTLYRYINSHAKLTRENGQDGNEFIYVPWSDYLEFTKSCVVIDGTGQRIAP